MKNNHHHAMNTSDVLAELDAGPDGLSKEESRRRLDTYGPNTLPKPKEAHPILKFLSHFHNMLIYVLIAAAVVTALLNHWVDTWIILAVVIINASIGYIQEGKAEKALQAVQGMLSLHTRVLRDGDVREMSAAELVPGDIILLSPGDKVPADARVFQSSSLRINEAALTGEAEAVEKQPDAVGKEAALGDRFSMVYSGTLVVSGQGKAIVCATGSQTEIGKITTMLSHVETLTTPLLKQVAQFSKYLTIIILAIGIVTLAIGYFIAGLEMTDLFMAVVGIAVASIPEGLPAIMTITLAVGVQKMAKRNAIIRKLPGVETLGSVTVICSDKTGTLTKSEMTVTAIVLPGKTYQVTGTGYAPEGKFKEIDAAGHEASPDQTALDVDEIPSLKRLLLAGTLCNDGRLRDSHEGWAIEGNPTEGALLAAAGKAEIWLYDAQKHWPRTAELPFDSSYKFMATVHDLDEADREFPGGLNNRILMLVKGAPDVLIAMCAHQRTADGSVESLDHTYWKQVGEHMAGTGQRVLAIAETGHDSLDSLPKTLSPDDVGSNLTLLGFVGIMDPPREEAIAAVRECQEAGITVKMITGDHAATARYIGHQLGIGKESEPVTGAELDKMSDEELVETVRKTDIFARVSPEHKLRLVTALQKIGNITAMTGDGVNDAPALKKSDIGIAMGIKGTEAAKEAAEMVLADDNFASIAHAVEEGRTVYDNLKKSLLFILPTNGGEALIIIAAILFGLTLPITPAQILWVNMVTAVTLALALAFEPMEQDVMKRSPRSPDESLVPVSLLIRILFVSVLLMAGSLGLFAWYRSNDAPLAFSRTVAVNALVFGEIVYLFASRLMHASSFSRRGLTATKFVWAAVVIVLVLQAVFTYVPAFHLLFDTASIGIHEWLLILGVGILLFFAVELEKKITLRSKAGPGSK